MTVETDAEAVGLLLVTGEGDTKAALLSFEFILRIVLKMLFPSF
jgi:hypothetical protein